MWIKDGYFCWRKGHGDQLSAHFHAWEFECRCNFSECVGQRIERVLIDRLEACARDYGAPIGVNRGYSCQAYQDQLTAEGWPTAKVGQHPLGKAADVRARMLPKLVPVLRRHFNAVGVGRTFAHVDTRDDKVRAWTYDAAPRTSPGPLVK